MYSSVCTLQPSNSPKCQWRNLRNVSWFQDWDKCGFLFYWTLNHRRQQEEGILKKALITWPKPSMSYHWLVEEATGNCVFMPQKSPLILAVSKNHQYNLDYISNRAVDSIPHQRLDQNFEGNDILVFDTAVLFQILMFGLVSSKI